MDYFGDNIQAFILQAFKEDTPLFKFLEENTINMVFSNNKLHCNKDDFIKVYNMLFGPGHVWPSISRNFNYHRMKISSFSYCDRSIIITFPDDFSLDKPFRRSPKKIHYHCEVPGCGYTAKQKISVKIHMLKHNCNEHYKCEVPECGYNTSRRHNFLKHMITHKREPKFSCEVPGCRYTTNYKSHLKSHMSNHTKDSAEQQAPIDVDDQSTVIDVDDQSTVVDVDDLIMLTS
jgi:hypothetical protein